GGPAVLHPGCTRRPARLDGKNEARAVRRGPAFQCQAHVAAVRDGTLRAGDQGSAAGRRSSDRLNGARQTRREQLTSIRAPKPVRARARARPKAGPVPAPRPPAPAAERIGGVHLTAEYWPFARTGGLGGAGSGLASSQAAVALPRPVGLAMSPQG